MARAPALHAGGQGFDSLILHIVFITKRSLTRLKTKKKITRKLRGKKKVNKGAWRMPRLSEAKKDVISCDKLR